MNYKNNFEQIFQTGVTLLFIYLLTLSAHTREGYDSLPVICVSVCLSCSDCGYY